MINIQQYDHSGIRITDRDRALKFYAALGFKVHMEVDFDAVIVIKNDNAVEINLVVNGQDIDDGQNILMDVPEKHTGITHLAFRVESIIETLKTLEENDIAISQGPVTFGGDGHVSVFVRDPDRNTLEFRGRMEDEDEIPGLVFYDPNE
ncbi:MAG: VOC family protein [Rhodospirillaceae bacterium]|jgi:lactoylglutathione lyase|nr:VOC family protein [Rhodospirillaceae bacterium]MBT4939612.1 VOC family protein [Rhodospirillaceae bacterium]MBT5939254.1 VOC family protein [Rhodospirillaceae bacterium]MBT7266201.1 VOC family protein [Rhodospirillaceae bacterium]